MTINVYNEAQRCERLEELYARLRERGVRMTPRRKALLRILVMSPDHPTAEELHKAALAEFPNMSLATVYKTLTRLKEIGEVQELQFSAADNRFDGHNPCPHPHLICTACGRIVDPEVPGLHEMINSLSRSTGYTVASHRLDIHGLCPDCQGQSRARPDHCPAGSQKHE